MADDVSDIAAYYSSIVEKERGRLDVHQLEYDLTWRFLNRYLPSQGSILEVGAATGRYTLPLAGRGYTVTAVDMTPALLEECRKSVAAAGLERQVRLLVADARDLSAVAGTGFDAVLLMGPLYHLVEKADRTLALQQALDRLRAGGILFSSFITRFGIMGELLKKTPGWIEDSADVRSLLVRGRGRDNAPQGVFRGYYAQILRSPPARSGRIGDACRGRS